MIYKNDQLELEILARQLSEENVESCEPRYFLAFSLFRLLSATPEGEERENLKVDCNEAAQDTKRFFTLRSIFESVVRILIIDLGWLRRHGKRNEIEQRKIF